MQYGLVERKKWLDMSTCLLTHCSCRLKYEGSKVSRVCIDGGKQKNVGQGRSQGAAAKVLHDISHVIIWLIIFMCLK